MEQPEPAKLIMTWDIAANKEQEYFEFVVRDFIPGIQVLGFEIQEAWATAYGERPQIQVSATMSTSDQIRKVMDSEDWMKLYQQLLDVVENFEQKIVPARTRFQF